MSSPFAAWLGTNYHPSDQEVVEIESLLVEPTRRLKRLDDEIAQLQKAIDTLAEERESLGAYVAAHKALISPFRRLPMDIIHEIFIACLPTNRNAVMSAYEAPVLLGRICSSWRAISLSTPRLWARLHVVRPMRPRPELASFNFEKKCAQRLETMKAWLGRSGDCPLSISMEIGSDFRRGLPTLAPDSSLFFQTLVPFASRWQEISFNGVAPFPIETLLSLSERDVPLLRNLTIYAHTGQLSPSKSWSSVRILHSLRLSKLSLSVERFSPTELPVRWSQLTFLSLEDLDWDSPIVLTSDRALHILSQCPKLGTCALTVHDTDDGNIEHSGSIVECPFLNTMHLSGSNLAVTLPRMFHRLSLPELQQSSLQAYSPPALDSFSSFLAVAMRLESLNIFGQTSTKTALADLLRGLPPTMQRLQLADTGVSGVAELAALDDDILALLTPSNDLPSFCCPALRQLSISHCFSVSDAALLRLVNARMTMDSWTPLEQVEATFMRQPELDILPSLQQFIDSGLRISLKYLPPRPSPFSPWSGLSDQGPYHQEDKYSMNRVSLF
ncbi:hypothetical protein B0H19DRAFT_1096271 [Mycena capillaripes]|nr:hypothetical protein B0H19DRAFT_1096271 [Mycena capillaripes]